MPEILMEIIIAAAPDKVYKAITEQQGLASWWTTHMVAEPKVGGTVCGSFFADHRDHDLEVRALEPDQKVSWVVRQSFFPDWPGTLITWELSPVENGTHLLFSQRGFATTQGSLPRVTYGWAMYLTSLKAYLETGTGNPHTY